MTLIKLNYVLVVECMLATFALTENSIISFDLGRAKTPFVKLMESGHHPKYIERMIMESNNDSIQLFRYLDNEFYGEVLIGRPGQKFKVIFDSAWANSWVPSALCGFTDYACLIHNRYNSKRSSTYKADGRHISIPYGDSNLSGFLSMDVFHLASKNVTNQTFAEMTNIPSSFFLTEADGIFGLAFSSISYLQVTPFLDNMLLQKKINKKVFSFYFNRDRSSKKGGTLFLGGSQTKHYTGNFTYVDLIAADYWRFLISSIHIKGSTVDYCGNKSCPTIIDTSSIAISGPSLIIKAINKEIGAKPYVFGKNAVDCGSIGHLPFVTFGIGGKVFVLKPRDYIQKMDILGMTWCFSVFQENDLPSTFAGYWTLGAAFMARFYVEFDADNKRIGFAHVRM